MRVCFICVEIFAWSKYGGFGKATRTIGRELAKRGVEVSAVVPRRRGQAPVEDLDGITVYGFPSWNPWASLDLFQKCDSDVYHSSEPSLGTFLAQQAMADRKHIITVRDPRDCRDWRMEFALPSLNRWQVVANYLYESNLLVSRAVRRADAVYSTAKSLIAKIRRMYRLGSDPKFLPTPVAIPDEVQKATIPTVCFLARLDRRKRPELFLDLTPKFPEVSFIVMGDSRDARYDRFLRDTYGHLPNLEMMGFINQFSSDRHSEILSKSWVLVNTSTREGLPNAFLEASAHRCAILSQVDPDGFASEFGYHVCGGDFGKGLEALLRDEVWRVRGERGYAYVRETFDMSRAIDLHLKAYG
jgi:glycosyltransferase involved in cell wall biosynthesis